MASEVHETSKKYLEYYSTTFYKMYSKYLLNIIYANLFE